MCPSPPQPPSPSEKQVHKLLARPSTSPATAGLQPPALAGLPSLGIMVLRVTQAPEPLPSQSPDSCPCGVQRLGPESSLLSLPSSGFPNVGLGTPLEVKWLRLLPFNAGCRFNPVGELRPHMPLGQKTKTSNVVMKSIKTKNDPHQKILKTNKRTKTVGPEPGVPQSHTGAA